MSASPYYGGQYHADTPEAGYQQGYQQGYPEQQQQKQQNYPVSEQHQVLPPQDPSYGQGYSNVGYDPGLLYPPGEHEYRPRTGSAHEYYNTNDDPSSSYQGARHLPHDAQQYPQPQPEQARPGEEPTPSDGERGLGGSLLGGVAGAVAGHQAHHGLLGAVGGGIAGSLLENHFKKREHDRHERDEYEYEHEHRHRHYHNHGHHHHHHQHSRHGSRSASRNGGSRRSSFGDDGFREERYYGH